MKKNKGRDSHCIDIFFTFAPKPQKTNVKTATYIYYFSIPLILLVIVGHEP